MSKLYKIIDSQHSNDSYFFSDTCYEFEIIWLKNNIIIETFNGFWTQGVNHQIQKGIKSIKFIEDNKILLENFDGTNKIHELPVNVEIVTTQDDKNLKLAYQDGRILDEKLYDCMIR
ncbi:Hypothetical protein KVN_LOCUS6 [uncultured virus]|nr:Hypothetical protein KVN_LOCUS6 [uncultured virus]